MERTATNIHSAPLTHVTHDVMSVSIWLYFWLWPTTWKVREGIGSAQIWICWIDQRHNWLLLVAVLEVVTNRLLSKICEYACRRPNLDRLPR